MFPDTTPRKNEKDYSTDEEMVRDSKWDGAALMTPRMASYNVTLAQKQDESQSLNVNRYPKPRTPRDPGSRNLEAKSLAFNAHFEDQTESYLQK